MQCDYFEIMKDDKELLSFPRNVLVKYVDLHISTPTNTILDFLGSLGNVIFERFSSIRVFAVICGWFHSPANTTLW
jgi:hypothetical protein